MNRPPLILCIGRNYEDHAREMGGTPPERPTVFMKNPASVIEDGNDIIIPPICEQHGPEIDFEGELAVILGRDLRDATPTSAREAIRGYAAANDVTARWWQKKGSGGQWIRGKSFDTFCPIGNVIEASQVADPQQLQLTTTINGEIMQEGSTADMIFPVIDLLVELSRGMTLPGGTILMTGTPSGVGAGRTPPRFLDEGDTVVINIEGVGSVSNKVRRG
ncbi:MAG: 5-carboxymethyl-2-hydroxymuconate isomerase [Phycisphaerae bacterium]|nr:5-carboxymethyl-2-hydroxymuconate isomerase [Phycisphaerae bacterium]|tara:strand:+ start:1196 stop:1852 length:657 start_codon:yes stop_codon:yes gene_type:complete